MTMTTESRCRRLNELADEMAGLLADVPGVLGNVSFQMWHSGREALSVQVSPRNLAAFGAVEQGKPFNHGDGRWTAGQTVTVEGVRFWTRADVAPPVAEEVSA